MDGRSSVVVARRRRWPEELTVQRLVKPLSMIVADKFAKQMSKVALAEDHEVLQAFRPDSLHEPLRMGIAVWTLGWNRHALHALGLQ